MGDFDWQMEHGFWISDGDGGLSLNWRMIEGDKRPSTKERWAYRKGKLSKDEGAQELAQKLVENRLEIKRLKDKEEALKKELLANLEKGSYLHVKSNDSNHIVEHATIRQPAKADAKGQLKVIRQLYGKEIAEKVFRRT